MGIAILTQDNGLILGNIAKYILGPILNGIFIFLDKLPWNNSANIGVAIILFTIVIYLLMLPLTIKQQKFSKLQAKMNPEIQAIQERYKGKKDQDSQLAMNQEIQAVYSKYGVSPTGSCLQLLIQMPILFALYRVIYSIPAYVPLVKNAYKGLVDALITKPDSVEFMQTLSSAKNFANQFSSDKFVEGSEYLSNTFIDVLNRASSADWANISATYPDLSETVAKTMSTLGSYNNFLGVNIGYSPKDLIVNAWSGTDKDFYVILIAILIPVLSAVTQWLNVKFTPQAASSNSGNSQADQMQASLKMMNVFMPIFSAFICFSFPAGVGLYWIAGSVVRSVQQVLINKHVDKMDLDAEIKKNIEKRNAKLRRAGIDPDKVANNAVRSTKSIAAKASSYTNKEAYVDNSKDSAPKNTNYKPGSIAAKANMVKDFNERNNK